jgi:hypothetical protein
VPNRALYFTRTFGRKGSQDWLQMLSASSSQMAAPLAKDNDISSTSQGGHSVAVGPDQPREETWSTILQGVASTKIVPTKNVLILGMAHKVCMEMQSYRLEHSFV